MITVFTGNLRRDRFHFSVFVCNFVGVSFRVFGFGLTLAFRIQKP